MQSQEPSGQTQESPRQSWVAATALAIPRLVYGFCLLAIGAVIAIGGVWLLTLGGSAYYLPAGLSVCAAGIAVLRGRWWPAAAIYLCLMAASLVWGLWEAGLNGWALAPRVVSPAVLGLPLLVMALVRGAARARLISLAVLAVGIALIASVVAVSQFQPALDRAAPPPGSVVAGGNDDWPHFGGGQAGTRFSSLSQITSTNVRNLKIAWSTRIASPIRGATMQNEAVPLKIGDNLYVCTPFNDVVDLDPETGKIRWRFHWQPDPTGIFMAKCRSVAYYAVPAAQGLCAHRVYTQTADGRLIGLDAATGRLCPGFGAGGKVDLLQGIRQRSHGYYDPTSGPTVIRGKLVVGSGVADNQHVGEPSGVVRAYDAVTGKLAWAWDLGNPGHHGQLAPGQFYTPGTPNAWAPMSADETLGLVYVPTGNATPDSWGGHRSAESNRYASSVVALDADTGEPRWSFQTTHYDVWDYDVASQPVLFDLRTPAGVIPALLQPTKRGQLFVLDRRTGRPIFPVVERPAPQRGAVERLSPTQPWSPAMPDLGGPRLTERAMWGLTAVDQMWCRIRFRQMRYDGPLTPPGLTYNLVSPGYVGGVNWGSASIDTARQLAFLASNRIAVFDRLVPRNDPFARRLKADPSGFLGGPSAQDGTPYATDKGFFFSPLGVPCQAPPFGLINAVDLTTGKLVWSRPLGSARDQGPMRHRSGLAFTIGTMTFGGPLSTASGLVFVGASQDHSLRAFDGATGRLLFNADLPGAGNSSPMTYRSRSGRQMVAISSEAPGDATHYNGAVTAFALPN